MLMPPQASPQLPTQAEINEAWRLMVISLRDALADLLACHVEAVGKYEAKGEPEITAARAVLAKVNGDSWPVDPC